jgi:adenosylmethionine-8-amino-7-oxononanoate aminotransferase
VIDRRPLALDRSGPLVVTDRGSVLEVGGGSHATSVVNDGGSIARALSRILADGNLVVGSGRQYANEYQLKLADRIFDLSDFDGRVFFTSGGTESFETALRIAHHVQMVRGAPSKSQIVGHQCSYYGMSLGARLASDHPVHSNVPVTSKLVWPKLPLPISENIGKMEAILNEKAASIAAVILEPVAGTTAGAIEASGTYLTALRSACTKIGALLVIDETITSFGRVGSALLSTPYNPDIVFGGKCLGASFAPISALMVSGQLCDELHQDGRRLPLRLTFSGNAFACAAANAVQDYMEKEDIYARVRENGPRISEYLSSRILALANPCCLTGRGHLWGIHCAVATGDSGKILGELRTRSEQQGVEFLGAAKIVDGEESVHLMVTPALDLVIEQLEEVCDAGVDLLEQVVRCPPS